MSAVWVSWLKQGILLNIEFYYCQVGARSKFELNINWGRYFALQN